jgi:histidinol-phosphate/aromatic aminotransferase/cobyric acid decarboxylase-like protein
MKYSAINPHVYKKNGNTYGKSNDAFIQKSTLPCINCSLWTSPFANQNTIHHDMKIGELNTIYQYPTKADYDSLKQSILDYYQNSQLSKKNIHLGHWWLVLLERLANKFFSPSHILWIWPQFPYFIKDHLTTWWKYTSVEILSYTDHSIDSHLEKLNTQLLTKQYDICYIDNPNNPTGYYFERNIVEKIIKTCEKLWVICIIDEAYASFIPSKESSLHLVQKYANLIVLRSYSKWVGLSGARTAYLIMWDELSQLYSSIDNGFEPSSLSIKMCISSSFHRNFMKKSRIKAQEIKAFLLPKLEGLWLIIYPNHENLTIFLMQKKGINLHKALQKVNILTTPWEGFSLTSKHINSSFVRVLIPKDIETCMSFLKRVESLKL